jgi:hypothetical protein
VKLESTGERVGTESTMAQVPIIPMCLTCVLQILAGAQTLRSGEYLSGTRKTMAVQHMLLPDEASNYSGSRDIFHFLKKVHYHIYKMP